MNQAMSQGQLSVFESRAISQCLAEKTRQFLPKDLRGRMEETGRLYAALDHRCLLL
jgi:glutathione S-transferase